MVKTADHSSVIYGTHFPNRIFVGCLPPKAVPQDLADFFCNFGVVNEAKIVLDENGNSRRFGFVSFGNQDGVNAVLRHGSIFFLGKKINVGRAVKKQFFDDVKGQPATVTIDGVKMKPPKEGVRPHVIYQTVRSSPIVPTMATGFMMDNRPFPAANQVHNGPPYFAPAIYQPPHYPQATMLFPVQRLPMTTVHCVSQQAVNTGHCVPQQAVNTAHCVPQQAVNAVHCLPKQAINLGSNSSRFRPCFPSFPAPAYYSQPSYTVPSRCSPSFWSGNSSPSTISSQSPGATPPVLLQQPRTPLYPNQENKQPLKYLR